MATLFSLLHPSTSFPSEWHIRFYYGIIFFLFLITAKIISRLRDGNDGTTSFMQHLSLLSLAAPNWTRTAKGGKKWNTLLPQTFILIILSLALMLWIPDVTRNYPWWLRSYLSIIPFWLMIESISSVISTLGLVIGQDFSGLNNKPWRTCSVADFWGRRWNRLFADWLKQVCFNPLRRRPVLALASTFFLSGCIHELLVSVPLWLVYKVNCFGWMISYFLLQFLAIYIGRCLKKSAHTIQFIYSWMAILSPVPLILNQGTLIIFHLAQAPSL